MDSTRFDRLTRQLAQPRSRRGTFGLVAGAVLGLSLGRASAQDASPTAVDDGNDVGDFPCLDITRCKSLRNGRWYDVGRIDGGPYSQVLCISGPECPDQPHCVPKAPHSQRELDHMCNQQYMRDCVDPCTACAPDGGMNGFCH